MGGIAGIQIINGNNQQKLEKMLEEISHRGPGKRSVDSEGKFFCGTVSGNLSEKQGTGYAKKGNTAVFLDGEIYNSRQNGKTDAETVLDIFMEKGRNFASYLHGAFACAVIDGSRLILARDPVGIRPLYWGKTKNGEICFASEMKAFRGIAEEISELLPSRVYCSDSGISKFLPEYPEVKIPFDFKKSKLLLRSLIFEAVEKRLKDNAVKGCFLSGGLDSTIITAVMHELKPDLPAFTVGVEGASDVENAKIAAKYYGVEHHLHVYDKEEVLNIIPKAVIMLESFEEDCIIGAAANLIASRFASKKTSCMLSGEGGDELFGGYHLLKDLSSEDEQISMMDKLISISYNTALQRLDRSMFGNSIEYRTPFLDTEVISFALQTPVNWKIKTVNNEKTEKYILREAFKDMLPEEIYLRKKLRFSRGTGTETFLKNIPEHFSEEIENGDSLETDSGYKLNSKTELVYYKLFKKHFPDKFEKLVGRWDPNK
jgi:asparagine synthase (glutamine-hydrolysing)